MKKLMLLLAGFALFASSTAAQSNDSDSNKTTFDTLSFTTSKGKVVRIIIEEKHATTTIDFKDREPRKFWSGLDVGLNGFLTANNELLPNAAPYQNFNINQARSWYFGINLYEKFIPVYKKNVGLVSGLGMDFNSYRFTGNVNPLTRPDSSGNFQTRDYVTNRFRTFHATIPLLVAFDFGKNEDDDALHIAAGVIGAVRLGSATKEKYKVDDDVQKDINRLTNVVNPFRASAHVRVGYGSFTLWGTYALTDLFRSDSNLPQIYPFQIGIAFSG